MSVPDVAKLIVGGAQVGSAWLICPQYAVTAWHCVKEKEDKIVLLRWQDNSVDSISADANTWLRCVDLDVVLLPLTLPSVKPVLGLLPRRLQHNDDVVSFGYSTTSQPSKLQSLSLRLQLRLSVSSVRFDLVTATTLADLHGLSGGPILLGEKVAAINVMRGAMAAQIDALPITTLKRAAFFDACSALKNLPSPELDLALRARNGSVWCSALHAVGEPAFLTQDYAAEHVVLDGSKADFGVLAPQIMRLLGFAPNFVRADVEPNWLTTTVVQDITDISCTLSRQLDALCFERHLVQVQLEHFENGDVKLLNRCVQNCPALDLTRLGLTDLAQKSQFMQRLVKARPEGNVQRLYALTPRQNDYCDALVLLALTQAALPTLNACGQERHNLEYETYRGLFCTETFDDSAASNTFSAYLSQQQIRFVILSHEKESFVDVSLMGMSSASLIHSAKPMIIVRNRALIDSLADFANFRAHIGPFFSQLSMQTHQLPARGEF
jgi:hypothetical protein